MAKVTGVGGVFFNAKDPKGLLKWYHEQLGIPMEHGYSSFEGPETQGTTAFCFFPEDSGYSGEAAKRAMVNFRVDDLDGVLARLVKVGTKVDPKRDSASYGKFGWFWDPEGNRVELWEPVEG